LERPATATPLTADELAPELVAAYARAFGAEPDRNRAELLLALLWLENARGAAIIQHNWGNISTRARDDIEYWRPPWFDIDAINALDDEDPKKAKFLRLHADMLANKMPSAFRAFDTHEDGAATWLHNVPKSMMDAASSGDPFAFAQAYFSSHYCPDIACRDSGPSFERLQAEIRGKGLLLALEPSKKKILAEADSPSESSSQLESPESSSGRLFVCGPDGAAKVVES
jgi:hypothetical protein